MSCKRPVNRLLMWRARGLCGPLFQNIGKGVCAHTTGNFFGVGQPGSKPILPANAFVFSVETTVSNETFTLPCGDVGVYNAKIDWGDDNIETITSYNDPLLAHEYASAGIHTIVITGSLPWIYFNNSGDREKVRDISQWGDVGRLSCRHMFMGCSGLTISATAATGMGLVTSVERMFHFCTSLLSFDGSQFDDSNVTTNFGMFIGCTNLVSADLSGLGGAKSNNWDFGFSDCTSLETLDLSNFDFSKMLGMSQFIGSCTSLTTLKLPAIMDVPLVTNLNKAIYNCNQLENFTFANWNIASVTRLDNICNNMLASSGSIDASLMGVENLTAAPYAFYGITLLNYDDLLVNWEAQNVQDNVVFHAGNSIYSAGAPAAARQRLIDEHNWDITDGGPA